MALPPVLVLVAIIATLSSVCPQALLSCVGEMEPGGACLNYWIKHLSMRWALNNEILWLMIVLWHITKLFIFIFAFLWNLSHLPHTVCCTHTEVHEESIKACPMSLFPVLCTWLTSQLVLLLYSSGTSSRIFSRSYSGSFSLCTCSFLSHVRKDFSSCLTFCIPSCVISQWLADIHASGSPALAPASAWHYWNRSWMQSHDHFCLFSPNFSVSIYCWGTDEILTFIHWL